MSLRWIPVVVGLSWVVGSLQAADASWNLVWADEFEGTEIDRGKWKFDLGGNGWGNQELQHYTDRPENCHLTDLNPDPAVRQGALVIEARKESFEKRDYTSARLKTQGLHQWTHGKVEARLQLPRAAGAWPAFWMLGGDIQKVGWPRCGEIDIMEWVTSLGTRSRGALHGPGYSGGKCLFGDWPGPLDDGFHIYGIEWERGRIRWVVDGQEFLTLTPSEVTGEWAFDHPFFILLNLAVGGRWPGPPDATTPFPLRMVVDYVRVYQRG